MYCPALSVLPRLVPETRKSCCRPSTSRAAQSTRSSSTRSTSNQLITRSKGSRKKTNFCERVWKPCNPPPLSDFCVHLTKEDLFVGNFPADSRGLPQSKKSPTFFDREGEGQLPGENDFFNAFPENLCSVRLLRKKALTAL